MLDWDTLRLGAEPIVKSAALILESWLLELSVATTLIRPRVVETAGTVQA